MTHSAPFSPPGNRAIFSIFWGDSLTKLHSKPGETEKKSTRDHSKKSSGDGAPKLQISVPCRGRKYLTYFDLLPETPQNLLSDLLLTYLNSCDFRGLLEDKGNIILATGLSGFLEEFYGILLNVGTCRPGKN